MVAQIHWDSPEASQSNQNHRLLLEASKGQKSVLTRSPSRFSLSWPVGIVIIRLVLINK